MTQINNYGILTGIMWNSYKWTKNPSKGDLEHSNYGFVKENASGMENINFGHNKYPLEPDDTYIGYSSMFKKLPSVTESKNVDVVFFRSQNWKDKVTYIVGMYAFPEIDNFYREADHEIYDSYNFGNIKSITSNIVLFENYLPINPETLVKDKYLPPGKLLGQQGFNYLHSENVLKILDRVKEINPTQKDLLLVSSRIKKKLLL